MVEDVAARIGAAGRAAFPDVVLPPEAIAARLAAGVGGGPDPRHDADLYLAWALAANVPNAVRVFEAQLVPQIDVALRRLRLPGGIADEVKQAMRIELLVETPRGAGGGRIADYAGLGELAAWVRVSATRKALKLARKAGREETLDDLLVEAWPDGSASPDPEDQHLRATYAAELKRAIGEAFAGLAVRQRNLLRQHLLDELTIDDLARLYRVHRATCARWLAEARADLGRATRQRLVALLGLTAGERVDSLLRFLDSDIELSIARLLVSRPV